MSLPVVFFDISIGGQAAGRIEMTVRACKELRGSKREESSSAARARPARWILCRPMLRLRSWCLARRSRPTGAGPRLKQAIAAPVGRLRCCMWAVGVPRASFCPCPFFLVDRSVQKRTGFGCRCLRRSLLPLSRSQDCVRAFPRYRVPP